MTTGIIVYVYSEGIKNICITYGIFKHFITYKQEEAENCKKNLFTT